MSTNCGCEPKKYNISLGCCVPVVAPADQYYTKYQTDKKIEEAISGITGTTGCCITPEEVDEKIEEAISGITVSGVTEEQMNQAITSAMTIVEGEIPSLDGYATEQWVEDKHYITGVDLSDYVTYESLPDLTSYATKQWVINQNYVVNSELIQYITNLQNQIDSLKQQISGCCGDTGETLTRWITMTGENDYTCSGTTKMTKEKEQQSDDGGNTWTDTGNYRTGSTVLEVNSVDCGYQAPLKFDGNLMNGGEIKINCNSSSALTKEEVYTTNEYTSITIGDCVSSISEKAFINSVRLTALNVPGNVKTIGRMAFANSGISALTLNEGVEILGEGAFKACSNLRAVTIPNSVKQLVGDTFYTNNIKTLVIGSGVLSIGNMCFQRSSSVTGSTITVLATTPPAIPTAAGYDIFSGWGNAPIYVPAESVNAYKSAWPAYASRIQAIP